MSSEPITVSFDGEGLRLDTSEDAQVICDQLMDQNVEILILQGNTFNIEAAEAVGQALANNPNLREAHFKDLFTSRGREVVPEALSHLLRGIMQSGAQLTLLDLSDNAIGPIGAPSVIEFLESPSAETIEKLYMNNCGLGPEGSTSIVAHFPKLTRLRELICGRNRLENKGATNLSRALCELRGIELLKLNQNGINVPGIRELVKALEANIETIKDIDLSDNTIKAEGSEALSKVLAKCGSLRTLRLNDALLLNEGFSIICDALAKSPSFHELELISFEGNEISGQKIVDLIDLTFSSSPKSLTLDLLDNEFSPAALARLEALTKHFNILVDDEEDDESGEDEDDASEEREEGEIDYNSDEENGDDGDFNGYVDLGADLREVSQDFIEAVSAKPSDSAKINSAFIQLISTGRSDNGQSKFELVQILCEELGLIKLEETRKKKPLATDAIVYIGKRLEELPPTFRDFFQAVVKNNDDLGCGKILFEKLEI